jgi:molybdenum cofactor cytidylyltransferase
LIAAIVLTAGKSERMGRPKALLPFRGRTFLEHILEEISASRIEHAVVVVGHHRAEIDSLLGAPSPTARCSVRMDTVYNPIYEQGMSTSIQAGIRALPSGVTAAALFLVDHPLIDSATVDALIAAIQPGRIVLPVHNGRRGHPIVLSADVFEEILGLPSDQGLNVVVRRDPARVTEVPVSAPGILADIDTPADYENLAGSDCGS